MNAQSRELHVAVVIGAGSFGGAEKYVQVLCSQLIRLGHRVSLVGRFEGDLDARVRRVEVDLGPKWSRQSWVRSLVSMRRERRELLTALADLRPDIVHAQFKREQILLAREASRSAAVIWTEHGQLPRGPVGWVIASAYRRAVQHVTRVICVSEVVAEQLAARVGLPSSRMTVIPNPVDVAAFASTPEDRRNARTAFDLPPDAKVVCTLSRLEWDKGVDRMVAAMRALPEDFVLIVAGTGSFEEQLRARAADLRGRVRFLGHRTDVAAVLHASDVFALPSRAPEGLPMSLLEAYAAGLPAVVTNDCGLTDRARQLSAVVSAPDAKSLANSVNKCILDWGNRSRVARGIAGRFDSARWSVLTLAAMTEADDS